MSPKKLRRSFRCKKASFGIAKLEPLHIKELRRNRSLQNQKTVYIVENPALRIFDPNQLEAMEKEKCHPKPIRH